MRARAALLGVAALTLLADGPVYTAGLTPGLYTLKATGGSVVPSVCVGDLMPLIQAAHGADNCRFFTVDQRSNGTRVSYECVGGSSLMDLKAITPRSAVLRATAVRGSTPYSGASARIERAHAVNQTVTELVQYALTMLTQASLPSDTKTNSGRFRGPFRVQP